MSYSRYSQQVTTANATQTTVFSVPVPQNSSVDVTLDFSVVRSDFTNGAFGTQRCVFRRGTGNVARASGNGGLLSATLNMLGDFLTMPQVDMVANTVTQSCDIKFTGLAASNLNWTFSVNVRRNSP